MFIVIIYHIVNFLNNEACFFSGFEIFHVYVRFSVLFFIMPLCLDYDNKKGKRKIRGKCMENSPGLKYMSSSSLT